MMIYNQDPHLYIHHYKNFDHWDLWCGSKGEWEGYEDYSDHVTDEINNVTCPYCLDEIVRFGDKAIKRTIDIDSSAVKVEIHIGDWVEAFANEKFNKDFSYLPLTGSGDNWAWSDEEVRRDRTHYNGCTGIVIKSSDSHGLCYEVKFSDGTAWFDLEELTFLHKGL